MRCATSLSSLVRPGDESLRCERCGVLFEGTWQPLPCLLPPPPPPRCITQRLASCIRLVQSRCTSPTPLLRCTPPTASVVPTWRPQKTADFGHTESASERVIPAWQRDPHGIRLAAQWWPEPCLLPPSVARAWFTVPAGTRAYSELCAHEGKGGCAPPATPSQPHPVRVSFAASRPGSTQ